MASKLVTFSGEIRWAKLNTPDPKFDVYTLDLYLDNPSWAKFKETGLGLKVREDADGNEYIKLRRKVSKVVKGEVIELGKPDVRVKGETGYEPFDGLVGNGSIGSVQVRIYDTQKGPGHELTAVAIDELIEYAKTETDGEFPF